ncbi:hypothetical protein DEO72_LG8g768 [Vigna unguiculata]|uniref:Transposase n=1 Tax=Vigna unguiculata TaxID=3917 RepID=A0A4D6MN06_VIGUN|nr:hypothetical protein DEO72_LG8g768 [Vigna unguiculata]
MPNTYKDNVWESALKTRFCFKINEDLEKRDVMFKIGKLWREYRCKLWNEFYDPLMSRNELIKNCPENVSMDQWVVFVDYRLKPSTVWCYVFVKKKGSFEIASDISPNDLVGVIFGKEYLGWVRGLSFGACPTLAFKQCPTARLSGINFASSSGTSSNMDDKFVKMESELATV